MKNNNGAVIRRLSRRCMRKNRMRNVFALIAIALSGILFTAAFSLVGGAMQMAQENTMREVGGTFHAGIKAATMEQYEKTAADPLVKKSSFTIFIGIADNILDRQAEIRYTPEESTLPDLFITLEEGHLPREEREILVDTFTLEELGLPCALGEKVPLTFSFMGETVEEEFTLSGWYEGDHVAHASELFVSESYWLKLKGSLTDEDFVKWGETHPEDEGTGLTAGNFFFDNASGLEEKIRTVIQNAGYEPGTELSYGVNWAYMSSRMESVDPFTFLILASAVWIIRHRRHRERENEERAEALQKMVEELKSAPAQVQTESHTPTALRRAMLQQLGIIKMVAETPTEQNREMLRKISSIENDTEGELVNWDNVFELINTLYSGFYDKLHGAYGETLTLKEEQIIVLMIARFSTKEISVITGQTTSTIYVRKSSIRKKLGVPEKEDIVTFLRERSYY